MSLGVKNDSDLRVAWADLGAAAEGNSIWIRVLGLLVTTAHVQILPSIMIHCRMLKYPLGD